MANPLLDYILTNKQDGVTFKAMHLVKAAGDDLHARDQAIEDVSDMLACLKSETLLDSYVKILAPALKVKAATLLKQVNREKDAKAQKETVQQLDEGQRPLPKWINKDRYYEMGFDFHIDTAKPDNTGMYFPTNGGAVVRLTNFVMTPLFHVYSKDDSNRRFTEINNGRTKTVVELSSQIYTSADKFENELMNEGIYFCMDGFSKPHLNKIKVNFLPMYPKCYELKTLGWQPEGFFAFSNLIYKDGLINFNDYGVAQVDDINFLSMGASNVLKDVRAEDDLYANDKFLRFEESPISFAKWSELMVQVYKDNGMMGVAWVFLAAFKDVVFKRNKNCPIPYPYGTVQSGKTVFTASVCNAFSHELPPFNLNQGTDFAFHQRMARFRNVPMAFNEFDENAIKDEWFRAFKAAFDGEGREKGSGQKNKTKTQEVNCLPIPLGQFVSTKDDGSFLQRSIPLKFIENNSRTELEKALYAELKGYEQKGISGILAEVFTHRNEVSARYVTEYEKAAKQLTNDFLKDGITAKNRIVENYSAVLALIRIMADKLQLSFTYNEFYTFCRGEILKLNNVVSESNSLAEFWKMMDFLIDQGMLEQGWDFKIEVHTEVKVSVDRNTNATKHFEKPVKMMFIRFNNVHALYSKEKRIQTGKNGLNEQTIQTYMKDQDYYIGNNPGSNFHSKISRKSMNTSSFVLNYDLLNINLERTEDGSDDSRVEVTLVGKIKEDARVIEIINTVKVQFTLWQQEDYLKNGFTVEKRVLTRCFWHNLEDARQLLLGAEVSVRGMLSVTRKGEQEFRNMEVLELTIIRGIIIPGHQEEAF